MSIADPSDLLAEIDMDLFDQYRHYSRKAPAKTASDSSSPVIYVEPGIDVSHTNGASKNSSSNGVKEIRKRGTAHLTTGHKQSCHVRRLH